MNIEKITKIVSALTSMTTDERLRKMDEAYEAYEVAARKGKKYTSELPSIGIASTESYKSMNQIYEAVKKALPDTLAAGHSIYIPTEDEGMFIEVHVGMSHGAKIGKRRFDTIEDAKNYTKARKSLLAANRLKKAQKILATLEDFISLTDEEE